MRGVVLESGDGTDELVSEARILGALSDRPQLLAEGVDAAKEPSANTTEKKYGKIHAFPRTGAVTASERAAYISACPCICPCPSRALFVFFFCRFVPLREDGASDEDLLAGAARGRAGQLLDLLGDAEHRQRDRIVRVEALLRARGLFDFLRDICQRSLQLTGGRRGCGGRSLGLEEGQAKGRGGRWMQRGRRNTVASARACKKKRIESTTTHPRYEREKMGGLIWQNIRRERLRNICLYLGIERLEEGVQRRGGGLRLLRAFSGAGCSVERGEHSIEL